IAGLFSQKVDNFEGMQQRNLLLPYGLSGLQGCEQSERAVEAAARRHGVRMGACYEGSKRGCGSREPAQQIPARVDRYGETGGFKLLLQPRPALGKLRFKGPAG